MQGTRLGGLAIALGLTIAAGACDSGSHTAAPHPTARTSVPRVSHPTTTGSLASPPAACHKGSNPNNYDARRRNAHYAGYLSKIVLATESIYFHPVQFLVGHDADVAWHADHPDDPEWPPHDHYIVEDNPNSVALVHVADNVKVWQVRLEETGSAELKPGTFAGLARYLAAHKTGTCSPTTRTG